MIEGVVFDLDDTLYFEKDYVISGFKNVSIEIAKVLDIEYDEIFSFLLRMFNAGVRGDTFNRLIQVYPEIGYKFCVKDLVNIYRSHKPEIELLPEAKSLLSTLKKEGYRLGIISDGYYVSQMIKIKVLGLENMVEVIVLTDKWGKEYWKPHTKGFEIISEQFGLPHKKLCYVADNLEKDFFAPKMLGWFTVRFKHKNQLRADIKPVSDFYCPDCTIGNLLELLEILQLDSKSENY